MSVRVGLALMILLTASPGGAAEERDVAVTLLDFDGVPSPVDQAEIRRALLGAFSKRLLEVGVADASGRVQDRLSDARARIEFGKHFGARLLVDANVFHGKPATGGELQWGAELSLFDCEGGDFIGFEQSYCPKCSREEFAAKVPELAARLLQHDRHRPTSRLAVRTRPTTVARLKIDGRPMGFLPFEETMFVGTHEITVEADHYRPATVSANLEKGTPLTVTLPLEPATAGATAVPPAGGSGEHEAHRRPTLKIIGGSLIGLGAVGIGVGAGELVVNGRGTCDLMLGQQFCPDRYATVPAGAALLTLGGAAALTGTILLIVDWKRSHRSNLHAAGSFGGASPGL